MSPPTSKRFDLGLEGRILNRQAKRAATAPEHNTLFASFTALVKRRGLLYVGNLHAGTIYHPTRSMGLRDLAFFNREVRRIMGGSFYFNGRLWIEDGSLVTLEDAALFHRFWDDSEDGQAPERLR